MVKLVYLNLINPLIVNANGDYFFNKYESYFTRAKNNNNDGIIVKNVIDNPRGKEKAMVCPGRGHRKRMVEKYRIGY